MRKKYVAAGQARGTVPTAPILLAICLLAILTIMITACSGIVTASAGSANGQNPVHMNGTNFVQSSITIKKGQSLTLVNDDPVAVHIIENGTWDNNGTPRPDIEPGAPKVDAEIDGGNTKTFGPFNTAGTFQLYCTVHTGMNLTVIVK